MRYSNGIAWRQTGFRLEVQRVTGTSDRFLIVADLNPETTVRQRMSRTECARLGLLLVWRALFARTPAEDAARSAQQHQ